MSTERLLKINYCKLASDVQISLGCVGGGSCVQVGKYHVGG